MVEVVGDRGDDPIVWELAAFSSATNEDEQADLVTLMWFGRGDGGLQDWDELRAEAACAHNRHTVLYLLRTPLRPDFLEDALAEFAARAKTSNGNIWDSSGPEWTLTSGPAARGYASAQGGTEEGCSATRRQFREMLTAGLRLQSTG